MSVRLDVGRARKVARPAAVNACDGLTPNTSSRAQPNPRGRREPRDASCSDSRATVALPASPAAGGDRVDDVLATLSRRFDTMGIVALVGATQEQREGVNQILRSMAEAERAAAERERAAAERERAAVERDAKWMDFVATHPDKTDLLLKLRSGR